MTNLDKARIYINYHSERYNGVVTNDDIALGGQYQHNHNTYVAVYSLKNNFFPFAFTPEVKNFYLTLRKEKLKNLSK